MIAAIFKELCPNCGGDIGSDRLLLGLPCERCLPEPVPKERVCSEVWEGNLKELCTAQREVEEWEELFKSKVGTDPWSLQRSWAKKVFLKRSFALLAPTGVGKTTFGIVTALYLALKGIKSYIILPTKLLVEQVYEKITSGNLGNLRVLVPADGSKKKREEVKKRIEEGDFDILITTSMFLYRNHEIIPRDFGFIFVDDVDSFLKTAKNIDKALLLLGFSEEDIEKALHLIKLKEKRNKDESTWEEIRRLSEEVRGLQEKAKGVLVVSSATGNPRSSRIKLFRELLGFEVGRPTLYLRNIADIYEEPKDVELRAVELVKKLGKGGLVFVPSDKGMEGVERIKSLLEKEGVRVKSHEELKDLSEFERGDVDVLVGIASYRNPLTRGIDLPHVVRYALFVGVPKIVIRLNIEAHPSHLLWALLSVRMVIAKELKDRLTEVDRWIQNLRRYSYLSEEFIENTPDLKERIDRLREQVKDFLLSEEVRRLIDHSQEITLRRTEEGYVLTVADVTAYMQASGRTSRMYPGGITKGLSYLLVDDRKAFNNLVRKVRWFDEDVKFVPSSEADLERILEEVDSDRKKVRDILQGKEVVKRKEHIRPVLVVVESPNKARTIAGFFGKPVTRRFGEFEVFEISAGDLYLMITATLGHMLDLSKQGGFHGVLVEDSTFVPVYETLENKSVTVEGLRKVAQEIDTVYIATDPDTEGEKIGWDTANLLYPYVENIKRIEFHEVTRRAIVKALSEPRDINENLVKAQVLRRISDRWVGFEVSEILQKTFGKSWLSGGRVQIPVLGWVIEREKQYRQKRYVVTVDLRKDGRWKRLEFELPSKKEAKDFYERLEKVIVEVVGEEVQEVNPPPPFTTDVLLKEASDRLRFGAKKTMELAQDLFEAGYITYHRTDSTRVSDVGINIARQYVTEEFGEGFFRARRWESEGAHECIRPARLLEPEELRSVMLSGQEQNLTRDHLLLYELIFRRFMASQMKEIKVRVKKVKVKALDREIETTFKVSVEEEGFNRVLPYELDPDVEGEISTEGIKQLKALPKAYLFTQGSLVQEMKKRGIGRPSTYATTIEKLLERGYIVERKGFLFPTKLGKQVYEFLTSQEKIMPFVSEEFTRRLEKLMDEVEEGREDYKDILKNLYRDIIEFEASVRR